ncbi:hypothetical protein Emag_004096 [Eimeria magna]
MLGVRRQLRLYCSCLLVAVFACASAPAGSSAAAVGVADVDAQWVGEDESLLGYRERERTSTATEESLYYGDATKTASDTMSDFYPPDPDTAHDRARLLTAATAKAATAEAATAKAATAGIGEDFFYLETLGKEKKNGCRIFLLADLTCRGFCEAAQQSEQQQQQQQQAAATGTAAAIAGAATGIAAAVAAL